MNKRALLPASLAAALLMSCATGCSMTGPYYAAVPAADVGQEDGWRPYGGDATPRPEPRPEERSWSPRNEWGGYAPPRERLDRRDLEPVAPEENDPAPRPSPPAQAARPVDGGFVRAEPKDPPRDLSSRRTYSSVPSKTTAATPEPERRQPAPRTASVNSEWADTEVLGGNRGAFDRMVVQSVSRGKSSFEDGDGQVYFGQFLRRERGCDTVEVVIAPKGGLPILSRGLAYVCD
jgi:hypothetical protein